VAKTPNVDALATAGCVYECGFSTAGVCAPSRASIITGMFPTAIGAMHMRTTHQNSSAPELPTGYDTMVPHYVKCFPEYLRAAGYYCSNNSKTDYQFRSPLTAWDDCSGQAHWRNRKPGQPFFAVFNPTTTHESGMWPESNRSEAVTDPDQVTLPPYLPDTPRARTALAKQYDNIHSNDNLVGELLGQLEADGEADNTIVIIWSDHGEGLPRAKRWIYDAGIRVPLVVRWPGEVTPGTRSQQLVSMMDLGPTVLSCCGVGVPHHMQGQPFIGPEAAERSYVHACRDRFDESYDMVRAVRDSRYKYIRNMRSELARLLWIPFRNKHPSYADIWDRYVAGSLDESQQWFGETSRQVAELYLLEADPWEMTNLASDPACRDALQGLRGECDRHLSEVGDLGLIDESVMVRTWYPDGKAPQTAPVVFVPHAPGRPGVEPASTAAQLGPSDGPSDGRVHLPGPAAILCYCATQGASIAWTDEHGDNPTWHLYTGPIKLRAGAHQLRAKAVRIGYQDGPICRLDVTIRED
jgi:N-sulfoglucosamine sulfohydrolase